MKKNLNNFPLHLFSPVELRLNQQNKNLEILMFQLCPGRSYSLYMAMTRLIYYIPVRFLDVLQLLQ